LQTEMLKNFSITLLSAACPFRIPKQSQTAKTTIQIKKQQKTTKKGSQKINTWWF